MTKSGAKTRLVAGVLLLGAALLLAGCGQKEDTGKTIRVVRNVGGREGFRMHWDAWKEAFERDNPGWKMELVNVGDTQGADFYMPRIATNDLPEVIQTWHLTKFLADNGHLLPLPDDYFHKFGMPLPTAYKGKRYATMGSTQLIGIAVNRKMWRDIGITEPPATWDAFIDALRKLKAKGYKPLTYGAREWPAAVPLRYAIETNMYAFRADSPDLGTPSWSRRKDAGKVSFATDPMARKIMKNMIALLENFAGKGALSDGYNESKSEFFQGKSATWIMGCWIGGDLEPNKVDFEIDYWPIPSMSGRKPIFVTGSYLQTGWSVTRMTPRSKQEKSFAVLDALCDPKVYQTWLNAESMIPTAKKVAGVTGPQSSWPAAKGFYDSMLASYEKFGATRGASVAMDDQLPVGLETPMKEVMQDILTGNRNVDSLLKKLDTAWDSLRKAEGHKGDK